MGFKCSVFGHAFGDTEVKRDREEQGSEVVITITEVETCSRCDAERVVSENKEVTSLETPSDIVGEELDGDTADQRTGARATAETDTEPEPEPEPTAEGSTENGTDATGPTGVTTEEPAPDPADDDGVILEEEPDADEQRAPGEWPEGGDEEREQEWTPGTDPESGADGRAVGPGGRVVTVPEGSFRCPECEFSTEVAESSLRAGDFCPECHRGSLEHRVN